MKNIELGLRGLFRIVVSKDSEMNEVVSDNSFKNLILDSGLELMGTTSSTDFRTSILARFFVGSGTSIPSVSQTSLDSLIATTTTLPSLDSTTSSYDDGYLESVFTQQFAMGAAAGNLSEIGVGPTSGSLFSRARILDGGGNPTTITILPNEYLTVFYTLRCVIPSADQTYSVNATINGVVTPVSVTIRPASSNSVAITGWGFRTTFASGQTSQVFNQDITTPISVPSGGANVTNGVRSDYVPLSRQIFGDITATTNQGNVTGGLIRSLVHRFGTGCWQMGFTPPLPKDNTKTMSIRVGYSWNRA